MNIEEAIKIVKKIRQDYNLYYPMDRKEVEAVETLLTAYEKEKEKNKKAIDFINDKNNYFEDGENWQNILKIEHILEE